MKNRSKKPTARGSSAQRHSSGKPGTPSSPRLSSGKKRLFRLAAATLVPLLLLAAAELGLHLAGYGYKTSFFKHAVIDGQDCLVENAQFGRRFFPPELSRDPAPVVMRAKKPPGVYRIFLLGESAALGDPAPAFGVGRYLESLLRQRFPASGFEVVCVAMTAINSHAILPIARECARHEGESWIVYMGNNEMVGPFGAATVFGAKAPPAWLVRLTLTLEKSRVVQALGDLRNKWSGKKGQRSWEGMKLFLQNQLPPDDRRKEMVYRNFRSNLDGILRAGERAGVPIVLSTVAVNLKDFEPFASLMKGGVGTNLSLECAALSAQGLTAQANGDWPAAVRAYEQAVALAPGHAGLEFRLAQCELANTNRTRAEAGFARARDDDALPFRTDSRLNELISEAAGAHAGRGVHLVDSVSALSSASPAGIPGNESFYEHVHFTFDGNYRLAKALAGKVADLLPSRCRAGAATSWAAQADCELDLGLTHWNRQIVFQNLLRRLQQPPFAGKADNNGRIGFWRERLAEVTKQLAPTNAPAARAVYLKAIERRPDDFRLHWNFAEFLEASRDLPRATEEWRRVQSLIPQHQIGYYQMGRLLAEQGQRGEARPWLDRAVALRPDLGAGWLELGRLSLAENQPEQALKNFEKAKDLVPEDPEMSLQCARALSLLKRSEEAIEQAREALRLDPDFLQARLFLGEELGFAGRFSEAQQQFEAVLRARPDSAWAHLNLGVARFKLGDRAEAVRQFEEALRLDPKLTQARQYLDQLKP